MDALFDFLSGLQAGLIPVELAVLMGLIVLDVFLGAAAALRTSEFDFERLANFYLTMIVPFIIGWVGFVIAAEFVSLYAVESLPSLPAVAEAVELLAPASAQVAYAPIVAHMLRSIYRNGSVIYTGEPWDVDET